jgi:peptide/nickel transport system permease protein
MKQLWLAATAVIAIVLVALAAPLLHLSDPITMNVAARFAPSGWLHWLGQDDYGRDVLSRLIWGARTSLWVAFASSAIACVTGTAIGVAGGFLRGIVEFFALRSMDVVLCFPPLLLALLVVTLLGPGAQTLIFVLSVLYLPGFARIAYAGTLSVRAMDFVEAVRVLGAGPLRVMLRTILPNIAGPVLVQLSLAAANAIVLESGLSFLGLGVVPPTPSWGLMIGAARATMDQAPLLLLWPCLALTLTILAMNALCDALRNWVDPHPAPRTVVQRLRDLVMPGLLPRAPRKLLELRGLTVEIETPQGPIRPVRDVSLQLAASETLAIVGESGSGKSLTGLSIFGLLPAAARIAEGTVYFDGTDLTRLDEAAMRRHRGAALAMIWQDPMSSLNPVQRVGAQITEAIRAHQNLPGNAATARAVELLQRVGIPDPARRARAFPHELSGGMRQRVMVAMAIANAPRLVVADEPTASLDVTIQAQVVDLLAELKREIGLALIFISHSLPLVAEIADRVAVMYAGEIVEEGPADLVFSAPLHPYTAALLASVPSEDGTPPLTIPGSVPPPHALPPGCCFAPRCLHRADRCEAAGPPLVEAGTGRRTRCVRWTELAKRVSVPAAPIAVES